MRRTGRRTAALAAGVALALSLAGCATGYVVRAAYEEARLLWRRQPIEQVLARDTLEPAMRAKLELVLAVRGFAAAGLGLHVGGSYAAFAEVDGSQVVHVVSAAPRNALTPYTWWFPIVGEVPYRGYFDQADAEALAAELEHDGYDTLVRPAVAFSTLGWFDDPLPSTLLRDDEARLAETVVHELTHTTLYVPGQAAFNESFATFVGLRGAELFFVQSADAVRATRVAARAADALTFAAFLDRAVARLDAAYIAGIDESSRQALFTGLQRDAARQQWLTHDYAGFWRRPLNNAVIVQDRLYADRLDVFEGIYAANGGDLRRTIDRVMRAARRAPDAPWAALSAERQASTAVSMRAQPASQ
jgi:predicted aminopeptidase